ncbi:MAG: glycosyltransferase family 39 protein, partial [Chloroflexota bacterium]
DELNAVAHGSREYWPWRGEVLAWHMVRLVSVALGAITILCTYLAARALELRMAAVRGASRADVDSIRSRFSVVAVLAAVLVAFNPQFIFTSALVTNDGLLITLSAVLLWLIVREAWPDSRNHIIAYTALIGVVLGLAMLTKQSALLLVPVVLLSVWVRTRGLQWAILSAAVMLLVAGWWYLRNWQLYGDPFGFAVFRAEFATQPFEPTRIEAWIGALGQLHDSSWARFGWMNVFPPAWVIWFFTIIQFWALMGLARRLVRVQPMIDMVNRFVSADTIPWTPQRLGFRIWWPLVALPILAFAWMVSFALTAGLVAWQGRLFFPALPAIAIILACGLAAFKDEQNWWSLPNVGLLSILPIGMLLVALWLPFGVIRPAYQFYTLPESVALERLGTPTYGRFGKPGELGAELRGWRLDGEIRPGAMVELTLMWHALARQNRDWTVFVHLVDEQDRIVAENNRPPLDGVFPMTQWVAGDWIEDPHPLIIPEDLPPGRYILRVGLFDQNTGRRTGQFDEDDDLQGDSLEIGQFVVN